LFNSIPHETTTCEVGGALHEQTNEMKLLGIKKTGEKI
jgi:hypothetical protein